MPTESTATSDIMTSATSDRYFSMFEEAVENAASDGCGSNFCGEAPNQLLGSPHFTHTQISQKQKRLPIAGLPTLCLLCQLSLNAEVFRC